MNIKITILFLIFFYSFLFSDDYLDNIKENNLLPSSDIEYLENLLNNPISYKKVTKKFLTHYFFLSDSLANRVLNIIEADKINNKDYIKSKNIPLSFIKILKNYIRFEKPLFHHNFYLSTKYKTKPFAYTLKYQFKKDNISIGSILQKDEEDRYFFDYKSFFLSFHQKNTKIIIGNYNLDCGLFWSSPTNFIDPFLIKEPYYKLLYSNKSTYENFNLLGIGIEFNFKNYFIIPYYSNSKLTANMKNNLINSFDSSGIHKKEKDNVIETIYGFIAGLYRNKFTLITDFHNERFNENFVDNNYQSKNSFINFLFDYKTSRIEFISQNSYTNNKIATTQDLILIYKKIKQKISYRYFDNYFPFWHSKPYSHQTHTNNEAGWLYSLEFKKSKNFTILFYQDIYNQLKAVSGFQNNGKESGIKIYFAKNDFFSSLKFTYSNNDKVSSYQQYSSKKSTINLYFQKQINKNIRIKNYFAYSNKNEKSIINDGILFYQQFSIKLQNTILIFRITSVKSEIPIYVYENNVSQIFQIAQYNNDDTSFFILLKKQIFKNIKLELKYENIFEKNRILYLAISGKI